MNDSTDAPQMPLAARRTSWWPYLIWLLPAAALVIVVGLAVRWIEERGEVVTVTFESAGQARPGETKVIYQGVEAGQLVKISPNKDGRRIDFTLRLVPQAKPGLNTNARFWLIGASPTLSDLSSLRAVVSGVAIGYAPGTGGKPTRRFEGLEKEPIVLPGDRGSRYRLRAVTLGSIRERSEVLFHGLPIGKVTEVKFLNDGSFEVEIFVFQPYDALIKEGVRFWRSSPVRLSFAGGGVNATLAPASALLSGGIDLENSTAVGSTQSNAETEFTLYSDYDAAIQGLSGPSLPYDFVFETAAGDLQRGAAVTLLGFHVGEVNSSHLAYDERTHRPVTRVTALLYPRQLDPAQGATSSADSGTAGELRAATDAKLRELLHGGYRARLEQTPALVGARSIALVPVKGVPFEDLAYGGPHPRIPTTPAAGDIGDITSQAQQILAKVNRIPFEQIGRDVSKTLADVDQTMAQAEPQIGPLLAKLNDAATQLDGAAAAAHQLLSGEGSASNSGLAETIDRLNGALRSIQSLADYLDRHPEALIRGKRPDK
jgi:paraquat-inducible protein B